ncbi:hypothetical protein [Enterobacter phage SDFMU_Pec]|uniref:Uncharacterized protein n=1 Tax=Enterobacter phage SDFMU_Pec TaxID=3076136 RepID=A0AA96KQY9_9CAUD|nr:hypothetical protein [Enterobacter phage SDFMU_Pec]
MMKLLDKVEEYTPLVWLVAATSSALLGLLTGDIMYMICAMLAYLCAKAK